MNLCSVCEKSHNLRSLCMENFKDKIFEGLLIGSFRAETMYELNDKLLPF